MYIAWKIPVSTNSPQTIMGMGVTSHSTTSRGTRATTKVTTAERRSSSGSERRAWAIRFQLACRTVEMRTMRTGSRVIGLVNWLIC